MAEGKKSFTAYCDWLDTFENLPDDKAGQLIKHIFRYVNDQEPETDDILINAVFAQIKATLKRDLVKWENKRSKNRDNARKRWDKENANACERIKSDAKNAVSVSVSVSDSDSVNKKNNNTTASTDARFEKFWNYYGKKVDKKKCEKKWKTLTEKQIDKIRDTLPDYIDANPDTQYRKNPLTYLNGECWNDDIIKAKPKQEKLNDFEQPDSVYMPTPLSNKKQIFLEVDGDMTKDLNCGNAKNVIQALKNQYNLNPERLAIYVKYFRETGKSPNLDARDVRNGIETLAKLEAEYRRTKAAKGGTGETKE